MKLKIWGAPQFEDVRAVSLRPSLYDNTLRWKGQKYFINWGHCRLTMALKCNVWAVCVHRWHTSTILETTWIIYFGLNSINTKTFEVDLTVRKPQKVFTMRYLHEGLGYLKSAYPKMAWNRERRKWSDQMMGLHWAVWSTASCSQHLFSIKHWHYHRWHHSQLTVKRWHYTFSCEWWSTTKRSLQPFNRSGQVPVAFFSLFLLLGFNKQLKKPLHQSSVPSSTWCVPCRQSYTPPLEERKT